MTDSYEREASFRATEQGRTIERIRSDRDATADRALEATHRLEESLGRMQGAIRAALEGDPVRTDDFVPNGQYLREVVEYGSAFRALWYALGYAEGGEAR